MVIPLYDDNSLKIKKEQRKRLANTFFCFEEVLSSFCVLAVIILCFGTLVKQYKRNGKLYVSRLIKQVNTKKKEQTKQGTKVTQDAYKTNSSFQNSGWIDSSKAYVS